MPNLKLESSEVACQRLEVSAQTLYAYVSRGLVRSQTHPEDSRKRLYATTDINLLISRKNRGRSRQSVAQSTIDFGEPILKSRISRIANGQFYYRGINAIELSRNTNLEGCFELLCEIKIKYELSSKLSKHKHFVSDQRVPFNRFIQALAHEVGTHHQRGNKQYAFTLLRLMAINAAKREFASPTQAIHELLASSWTKDNRAPELIRQALVLSADHELNASTYATRVTASAGASLSACLLTGISTLSGDKHGGITDQCFKWMLKSTALRPDTDTLTRFTRESPPPGFGHRLYPNGDPRAIEMLTQCPPKKEWNELAQKVTSQFGAYPTLDFGLANLEHQLQLPRGAGFSIFAVGRTVGWLAHSFEQRRDGGLIRPRAS